MHLLQLPGEVRTGDEDLREGCGGGTAHTFTGGQVIEGQYVAAGQDVHKVMPPYCADQGRVVGTKVVSKPPRFIATGYVTMLMSNANRNNLLTFTGYL